jgi:hypothetical protein
MQSRACLNGSRRVLFRFMALNMCTWSNGGCAWGMGAVTARTVLQGANAHPCSGLTFERAPGATHMAASGPPSSSASSLS